MELISDGNIAYYRFKKLDEIDFINHLFSSRIGWSIENTFPNTSKILNIPEENIVSLKQVHGNHIEIIKDYEDVRYIKGQEGDGLITNLPNLVLMTYHADCVPIYFVDKSKKIIGLAHGGWKGTYENISGKMVKIFTEEFNSKLEDLVVGIGPSIGPCCYEISKDLGEKFMKKYKDFKGLLVEKDSKVYLDLWKLNYLQVREANVLEENMFLSKLCTSCNIDKFHSYRREKGTKNRMVAAINLI